MEKKMNKYAHDGIYINVKHKHPIELTDYPKLAEWLGAGMRNPEDALMNLVAEDLKDASIDLMALHETASLDEAEAAVIARCASLMACAVHNIGRVMEELTN